MFIGTIGFFFALVFLFIRFFPIISIFEMRTILPEAEVEEEGTALRIMKKRHPLYGLMAEFDNPTDLVAAARRTYEEVKR